MFDPKMMYPCGNDGQIYSYFYKGARIDAMLVEDHIIVGIDCVLPRNVEDGILTWAGMDLRRKVGRYRYADRDGCYCVQEVA
ncbi:MAG: hypothetical protein IKP40_08660 [Clostridia bacterium]|nr:hypothetical protein [Clostridia bacterium]